MNRYFYNAEGTITQVSFAKKPTLLPASSPDSVGYIDAEETVPAGDYTVDLTTYTLVPNSQ